MNCNKPLRLLSLFSGCGGFDLGFEKAGFETVFANDILETAKIAWENYFKKGIYVLGDIADLVKTPDIFPKNIDIVTGGFPCQDFSIAGKRKGFDSPRGQLYMFMREVIKITMPKIFVAENVKGLTNLGDIKSTMEHDFTSIGYLVLTKILNAADYGVPQSRERVFFIGFNRLALTKLIDPYPTPTHSYMPSGDLKPWVTVKQALDGLCEPEDSLDLAQQKYSKAKYMGKHCQGQIEVNLNSIAPTIRAEHHGNIEYRRLSKEHGVKYDNELAQGLKERRLTVRECARLQTFPDDYQFIIPSKKGVSASSAYKLIGNAVPPLLSYNIAKHLEKIWEMCFS